LSDMLFRIFLFYMLSFVLVALLRCVIFIFRFISHTIVFVFFNYIDCFVLLNTCCRFVFVFVRAVVYVLF